VDNAKYFNNTIFKEFCQQIGMKVAFTSVNHTTVYQATNFTPFQLMYRAEAMLPEEI
jgi:hypothetical protein